MKMVVNIYSPTKAQMRLGRVRIWIAEIKDEDIYLNIVYIEDRDAGVLEVYGWADTVLVIHGELIGSRVADVSPRLLENLLGLTCSACSDACYSDTLKMWLEFIAGVAEEIFSHERGDAQWVLQRARTKSAAQNRT